MSKKDLPSKPNQREPGMPHQGPDHSAPYPVSRMAPSISLVELAKEIESAEIMVNTRTNAKLQLIADQIRHLQEEARSVLNASQHDQLLHQALCHFKRIPGKTYHLYVHPDKGLYFSMLAPNEWGQQGAPHEFKGSYVLQADMSWQTLDAVVDHQANDHKAIIRKLLE
ncbi:MAG: DUF2452 domain-containing protein [Gammaproteobacteria bacterium]|nr:DUF2452 domain-containing protein [Gammaproteobacteria bacterium]